jgi:hypothetical protein
MYSDGLEVSVDESQPRDTNSDPAVEQFLLKIKVVKFGSGNRKMIGKSPAWWENFG